jgi:NAD(P)-binding Rossmann-like domain
VREVETDYLVVGAGASGMAFVDSLLSYSDADIVLVDRRHRAGGHWLDAYPFVRLHQPSAYYGVNSRVLGANRIDESGPNAGFYERATASEICDYYNRVLEEQFVASGRVRFVPMSEYRGEDSDGHHVVSLLNGAETTVKVRRKLVDATYVESDIPSRHAPGFDIDDDVRFMPPNGLVHLGEPASGFTVIGAGKTAVDTCCWLLDNGVAPDEIRWIKPREGWVFNRAFMQPLEKLGSSYMQLQAQWVSAAAQAEDATDFAHRLEAGDVLLRFDQAVEPTMFRGSTMSTRELEQGRQLENVVRLGHVRRISATEVTLDQGSLSTDPGQVYIDCTASGVRATIPRPLFEDARITLEYVTVGVIPWSASTVGFIEATRDDPSEKNRLCPPVVFSGRSADLLDLARAGMTGMLARGAESDFATWSDQARLNPAGGLSSRGDDPEVAQALSVLTASVGPAMQNFERTLGPAPAA